MKPFARYSAFMLRYVTPLATAPRAGQMRLDGGLGMGLPGRLEVGMGLPVGLSMGAVDGPGKSGPGLGDLRLTLRMVLKEAAQGGLSILAGTAFFMPTGHNDRFLGEGGFSFEGFIALGLRVFGAELVVNLGYLVRPAHMSFDDGGRRFEQDDDIIWKAGIRIPREEDVVFSLESEGRLGVATRQRFRPGVESCPVWLGGSVDYPFRANGRMGFHLAVLAGGTGPGILGGLRVTAVAVGDDDDGDGVPRRRDRCPVLREDRDGFEDGDGCPDPDNDRDGVPDEEDACPLHPSPLSDNGC